MKQTTCILVGLLMTIKSCCSSDPFGINSEWPAGGAARGAIVTSPRGTNYTLLGVGFCRGGPPGGSIATAMVSYVGIDGAASPNNSVCFDICDQLKRCTGVEVRISDQWCELQIPTLTLVSGSSRQDRAGLDWDTGADAAAEASLTPGWNRFNAVAGSPSALTTSKAKPGFGCWGKMMTCAAAPRAACDSANRYPCEESYVDNECGPCAPLFIPSDGSDARLPASASSLCIPDPAATPTTTTTEPTITTATTTTTTTSTTMTTTSTTAITTMRATTTTARVTTATTTTPTTTTWITMIHATTTITSTIQTKKTTTTSDQATTTTSTSTTTMTQVVPLSGSSQPARTFPLILVAISITAMTCIGIAAIAAALVVKGRRLQGDSRVGSSRNDEDVDAEAAVEHEESPGPMSPRQIQVEDNSNDATHL